MDVRIVCILAGASLGQLTAQMAVPARVQNRALNYPAAAAQIAASPTQTAPPALTLQDALALAQANGQQYLSAVSDANVAREDIRQAKAAVRPGLSVRSDYLGTQGNGALASGRFVTNDGVHIYREWAVVHQDFTPALASIGELLKHDEEAAHSGFRSAGVRRAEELAAAARARAEVARRGLAATVARAYYSLLAAQSKYATAQQGIEQAKRYLDIGQSLERGGEVAHSDVVKSQLVLAGQEQAFRDAELTMNNAHLDLSVLLYKDFNQNFSVVDDLTLTPQLPPIEDARIMAEHENPDLQAAGALLRASQLDVSIARQSYLPSLTADFAYGLEANALALRSTVAASPDKGPLPNLGYFLTVSLNLPVWDWGSRSSRVRQAALRRDQATVDLTATQRILLRNFQGFYGEAQTARAQVDSLHTTVDLAAESLRLNGLRYQAGEATILELVDAQTTAIQVRNAYVDGLARYRVALANLQTLTGAF